ncbi:hypothetical protein TNCV_2276601 [Trichonephila clavipes]|nr:hypothetical protein TNCV_2276601 [Trichonephila clavipes]
MDLHTAPSDSASKIIGSFRTKFHLAFDHFMCVVVVVVARPHWPAVLDHAHDVVHSKKSNTSKGSSAKSCSVSPRHSRMRVLSGTGFELMTCQPQSDTLTTRLPRPQAKPAKQVHEPNLHPQKIVITVWWTAKIVVDNEFLSRNQTINMDECHRQLDECHRKLCLKTTSTSR